MYRTKLDPYEYSDEKKSPEKDDKCEFNHTSFKY